MAQALNILALISTWASQEADVVGRRMPLGLPSVTLTTRIGRVTDCHLPGECKAREGSGMSAVGTALPLAWHEAGAQLMLVD